MSIVPGTPPIRPDGEAFLSPVRGTPPIPPDRDKAVELSQLASRDEEGVALAPLAATTDGPVGVGRGGDSGAAGGAATSGGGGSSDANAGAMRVVRMGLGGDMLRQLVERIDLLRSLNTTEAAANAKLQATVTARAAELAAAAERVRREEAATLCGVLPLLLAKQRRLEQLEKELVDEDLPMWQQHTAADVDSPQDGGGVG